MNQRLAKIVKKAANEQAKQMLKDLVYQVCNGGILQYCWNGFADKLLEYAKGHDIVQELKDLGCPQTGIEAIEHTLEVLRQQKPLAECQYCGGSGEVETTDVDEYGDPIRETCYDCGGDGYEKVDKWEDTDKQDWWMPDYDNWFSWENLDIEALDDWTGQSHHHSVMRDMMEQNKGE